MIRRAMVLAAGKGTRLAPLTHRTPKPLLPVGGRPLLEHILEFLRAGGITYVVINLHHLGNEIVAQIGDGARFGLEVQYSWEDPILDTGGGIKRAEPYLRNEPFVVANGDSLLELNLRRVLEAHLARGVLANMVVRPDPDAARYGVIELDAHDRVRRVAGLPRDAVGGSRIFMFPGLHVFDPSIFDWMDAERAFSVTHVTYPALLRADAAVLGFVTDARWLNIDTPAALAAADAAWSRAPFRYL